MISHKHKFIFIHIPKAAGTTIEKTLFPYASASFGSPFAKRDKCYRNKGLFNIIKKMRYTLLVYGGAHHIE